jgi:hypothetical protein
MALISYKEWRSKITESSPTTRLRAGYLMGNYPLSAGYMTSRSSPSPAFVKKAKKELRKGRKKHKKGKKHGK